MSIEKAFSVGAESSLPIAPYHATLDGCCLDFLYVPYLVRTLPFPSRAETIGEHLKSIQKDLIDHDYLTPKMDASIVVTMSFS
jgi:hypothetical protein